MIYYSKKKIKTSIIINITAYNLNQLIITSYWY